MPLESSPLLAHVAEQFAFLLKRAQNGRCHGEVHVSMPQPLCQHEASLPLPPPLPSSFPQSFHIRDMASYYRSLSAAGPSQVRSSRTRRRPTMPRACRPARRHRAHRHSRRAASDATRGAAAHGTKRSHGSEAENASTPRQMPCRVCAHAAYAAALRYLHCLFISHLH